MNSSETRIHYLQAPQQAKIVTVPFVRHVSIYNQEITNYQQTIFITHTHPILSTAPTKIHYTVPPVPPVDYYHGLLNTKDKFNSLGAERPSLEAASCAATQALPSNLRKQKVQYNVHKSHKLFPILNQIDQVHTT